MLHKTEKKGFLKTVTMRKGGIPEEVDMMSLTMHCIQVMKYHLVFHEDIQFHGLSISWKRINNTQKKKNSRHVGDSAQL